MLKRHQILLTDWMTEYVRFVAERYDMSFSEVIRAEISFTIIASVSTLYPKFKTRFDLKKALKMFKDKHEGTVKEEDFHKMLSQLYFEARKAAEFRMTQKDRI